MEICPASSAAAGFCLSGWPDASCNRWVSHYKLVLLIFFFFFLFRGSFNTFLEPNKHEHRVEKPVELTFMVERHTHCYLMKVSNLRTARCALNLVILCFCQLNLVVCVSVQTACALQFLHERNISHLDLKPQNILLSGSVLKLAGDHMPTSSQTIKQMRMNFACG